MPAKNSKIILIIISYILAVFFAVVVTLGQLLLFASFVENTAPDSLHDEMMSIGFIFPLCIIITAISALPGFILALAFAKRWKIHSLRYFISAGLIDALVAFSMVIGILSFPQFGSFNFNYYASLTIIPGGIVGGYVYWVVGVQKIFSKFTKAY